MEVIKIALAKGRLAEKVSIYLSPLGLFSHSFTRKVEN